MVSRETVVWAYRLILGREPENDAVIAAHSRAEDIQTLRRVLLNSEEFARWSVRERPINYTALTGDPPVPAILPIGKMEGSRICRQADLCTDAFRYWMWRMRMKPAMHRKLWEWFFIADALFQRNCLEAGQRGIGFGVGGEPLTALFASNGCDVLATDLSADQQAAAGWIKSGQHARDLAFLRKPEVCDDEMFTARVRFLALDMNDIPTNLDGQFDFCWSSCALEHLGSLEQGWRFVERAMALLKTGGIAVHTTEYNMQSNVDTLETPMLSLYRRCDVESLAARLETAGNTLEPVNWERGLGYADGYVDLPPFSRTQLHLRLKIASYTCTSLGLVIRKGSAASPRPGGEAGRAEIPHRGVTGSVSN